MTTTYVAIEFNAVHAVPRTICESPDLREVAQRVRERRDLQSAMGGRIDGVCLDWVISARDGRVARGLDPGECRVVSGFAAAWLIDAWRDSDPTLEGFAPKTA